MTDFWKWRHDVSDWDEKALENIVGWNVTKVEISDGDMLLTATKDGETREFFFYVQGDCCSYSYFYDMYGIDKLINNGPVTEVAVAGEDDNVSEPTEENKYEVIAVYGFKFITVSEQWGEQTTVLSFRNESNGYYGGWMELSTRKLSDKEREALTDVSDKEFWVNNE